MEYIISSSSSKNNSQLSNVRNAAIHLLDKSLNKSQLAFLKIVYWFCLNASQQKCFLKRSHWNDYLPRFGGKVLSYRQRKRISAYLQKEGYIQALRESSNMNKEYTYLITQKGIDACVTRESREVQPRENVPSENQKCPLEKPKMSPPLRSRSENKIKDHDHDVFDSQNAESEESEELKKYISFAVDKLVGLGVYRNYAKSVFDKHPIEFLDYVWLKVTKHKPLNRGAYWVKVLENELSSRQNYAK